MIDAEGQYEGRYAAADRYIRALRARIGAVFPLSLAGFPYVDYHPAFPYSVFFGPGGATFNQPQMYWKAIGTSVRAVFEHTYLFNRALGPPDLPARADLRRRRAARRSCASAASPRATAACRRAGGTGRRPTPRGWSGAGHDRSPARSLGYRPVASHPVLKRGSQRRPRRLGAGAPASRRPDSAAGDRDLRQADHAPRCALPGRPPASGRRRDRHADLAGAAGASNRCARAGRAAGRSGRRGGARPAARSRRSRPLSASLPAKAYEIDPGPAP